MGSVAKAIVSGADVGSVSVAGAGGWTGAGGAGGDVLPFAGSVAKAIVSGADDGGVSVTGVGMTGVAMTGADGGLTGAGVDTLL